MTPDGRTLTEEALDALVDQPGMLGAMLVRRDGVTVLDRSGPFRPPEPFASLEAASFAAAELAAEETGESAPARLVTETRRGVFVAAPVDDALLLVALADPSLEDVLPLVEEAVATLRHLLGAPPDDAPRLAGAAPA